MPPFWEPVRCPAAPFPDVPQSHQRSASCWRRRSCVRRALRISPTIRSASLCRPPRAAVSTHLPGSSPRTDADRCWASRFRSKTRRAPAAVSPPTRSIIRRPTATHCSPRSRRRSPPIRCSSRGSNYDPTKLEPVAIMSHIPNVLLVRPDFPAKTVQELIAYAKANPGKLNYASQGVGTTSHLTAELFASITARQAHPCALQGHRAGAQRHHCQPCRSVLHRAVDLAAAAQGRQGAHSCRRHQAARARHPGYPDAGRGGRKGLRIRHLERAHRAAQDPGRDHRQAQ